MRLHTHLSTLVALFIAAPALASSNTTKRQVIESGDYEVGYGPLPDVDGATLRQDWEMSEGNIPIYLSASTSAGETSNVKRAVIVAPGKLRDCWNHFVMVHTALQEYVAEGSIGYDDVSIMAPCFLTEVDQIAGAATGSNMLFGATTWVSGHKNTYPDDVNTSAYDVVDEFIAWYMNKDIFPNLEAVVFAGHSAGGQMAQRYAAMRNDGDDEDRLHYWVANPGSLVWLAEDRPLPNETCEGVDSYKYGIKDAIPAYALSAANALGRSGIVSRYLGRQIHYAWGLADDGAGDTRCQAQTQGMTHIERGENFVKMLETLGGLPEASTIDWVEGVSHDPQAMASSPQGKDKLFTFRHLASEDSSGLSSSSEMSSSEELSSALPIPSPRTTLSVSTLLYLVLHLLT